MILMQRFMIDTNILIHTIKNRPEDVRRHVEAHHGEICASRIAAMDLLCGAHKFHAVRRNLGVVEGGRYRLRLGGGRTSWTNPR